jgi:exodeoxyribonuclease VII small subunit
MSGREPAGPAGAPKFETMMNELEQLVGQLESGKLSLEESISSFERGMDLVKKCNTVLDQAEQKIQELTKGERLSEADDSDRESGAAENDDLPF